MRHLKIWARLELAKLYQRLRWIETQSETFCGAADAGHWH